MKRIIFSTLAITVIIIIIIQFGADTPEYNDAFVFDAVFYPKLGTLKVSFNDTTSGASNVTLQILGLDEVFTREYFGTSFEESIEFDREPRYGWKAHPVIVRFDHSQLGNVGIKTEAHNDGDTAPKLVYESP
ncbi:MAG: putative exported protein [Cenarchaeum symbiont of Oopsacas minuta]|nr:putative exported protein [Cenarchaeum symbiont of Oopsacas minuta]